MSAPPPPPKSKKKSATKRKREEAVVATPAAPPPPKRKKKEEKKKTTLAPAPATPSVFDKLNQPPPEKKKKQPAAKKTSPAPAAASPSKKTELVKDMVITEEAVRIAVRREWISIAQEVAAAETDDDSPLVRAAFAMSRRTILGPNGDKRANDARAFLRDPKTCFVELFNGCVQSARESDGNNATSV